LGEQLAAHYLRANGYTILERNWRVNRAEIDLIVRKNDTLIFVEVKSRSTAHFGPPEAFVSKRKKRLLASAASAYMQTSGYEWAIRFDIVSVLLQPGESPLIEHFEDAFFPGLFE
jgi:putative endonuclease